MIKYLLKGIKGRPGSRTVIFQVLAAPELQFSRVCLLPLDGLYSGIYGPIMLKIWMCAPLTLKNTPWQLGLPGGHQQESVQQYIPAASKKDLFQVQEPPGGSCSSWRRFFSQYISLVQPNYDIQFIKINKFKLFCVLFYFKVCANLIGTPCTYVKAKDNMEA